MKTSDETLRHLHDLVKENRSNFQVIVEKSDRIIVWLVGFSIAIIALLLSNNNAFLDPLNIKINLSLIYAFVIFFGIFYRIFSYLESYVENKLLFAFEGYIKQLMITENIPEEFLIITPERKKEIDKELDVVIKNLKYFFNYPKRKLENIRSGKDRNKFVKALFWPLNFLSSMFFLLTILAFLAGNIYFIVTLISFKICR